MLLRARWRKCSASSCFDVKGQMRLKRRSMSGTPRMKTIQAPTAARIKVTIVPPESASRSINPLAWQVGQKHDARLMRDHEFGPRLERDRLRWYSASPKHGDLTLMNCDGVAKGWSAKIGDADFFRAADMNRRAVGMRIASRKLANQLDLAFGNRSHRHYGGAVETTGGATSYIGHEHR